MKTHEQPRWRHISDIAVFTELLQGLLESSIEQLATLNVCKHRPHVPDEQTLNRYIALHTEQRDSHRQYTEQFARWQRGKRNESQNNEVIRLISQSLTLKATNEQVLPMVEKLALHTVDSLMAMDDELALTALTKD